MAEIPVQAKSFEVYELDGSEHGTLEAGALSALGRRVGIKLPRTGIGQLLLLRQTEKVHEFRRNVGVSRLT